MKNQFKQIHKLTKRPREKSILIYVIMFLVALVFLCSLFRYMKDVLAKI